MSNLLFGVGLLIAVLVVIHQLTKANARTLAVWLKRVLIVLALAGAGYLLVTGRLGPAVPLLFGALLLMMRFGRLSQVLRMGRPGSGASSSGQSSSVETAFVRMTLDHDSSSMAGTVLKGRFAGRDIASLAEAELVDLYLACLRDDEPAARLVESFLDRGPYAATWRSRDAGNGRAETSIMTADEARSVLGLRAEAGEADVQAAYHRLMAANHPDRGGSDYLAAKINQARDVLKGRHRRPA
ncbi:MAG: molecular chaperone DnaJ [Alphaproteobacteria bacterium]|nr:molecular chaperone DnaJ [Alphaproteobacteria bacterium]